MDSSVRYNNLSPPGLNFGLKRRIAPVDVEALRKQLKVLAVARIIEEDRDPKPIAWMIEETVNREVRFCFDYQHFTQRTVPYLYNNQNIEKGLNFLVGNQYFSVLAMASGNYQLPNFPGEREKPYSVHPLGFYEYERMQPGYLDCLAKYQRMMENILSDLNMVELLVYLDYIIVIGKTYDEHKMYFGNLCKRLQDEGLGVLEKTLYCRNTVSYMGHSVCQSGISIDDDKLNVLRKWPKPRTVSELHCYVEFCSYYRQFISSFQDQAKPLTELLQDASDHIARNPEGPWWTKESIEEKWTKECEQAFYQLKIRLLRAPLLPRANMSEYETQCVEPKKKS